MLHILWLIVKFILILLGTLLGLVLLVLLLLLFCPLRYSCQVSKRSPVWKETEGWAKISWLFHGISVRVYQKDGGHGFSVKILGIPIEKLLNRKKKKSGSAGEHTGEISEEQELLELSEEWEDEELESSVSQGDWEVPEPEISEEKLETAERKGLFLRISEKLTEMRTKIQNIGLTLRSIHDKIDWWKKFLQHPRTKAAVALVWKHGKGLIRHILPVKVWGEVTLGFSDPSITGRVLGLLGMSFPFHKNCVVVMPRFDGENVLEGEISFKGRIYGIVFVKTAVMIYFNKNVKYVIRRAKRRNHKEG